MTEDKFALWLRQQLEVNKMKQVRLAEALGVTPSTVSNWLKGKFHPSDDNLELLSVLFKKDIPSLYGLLGRIEPDAEPSPLSPETESIVRLLESIPTGPIRRAALMAAREVLLAFVKLLDSEANDRAA